MNRTKFWMRIFAGGVTLALCVGIAAAILHAKGISFQLTHSYFTLGPVHAQDKMSGRAKPVAAPSSRLTVTVDGKTTTFSSAALGPDEFPQKTVKVHNEHTKADETYVGPTLGDVLASAGFDVTKATQREMLHSYVRAEGTDKYWVLYSLTEVEPSEHSGDVIVATDMSPGGLGADGQFKLISSEDKKPQRWVRNLTAITVTQAQ
ncbi:MAG TPA: hypothetical protein VN678_09475 [Acidobacteriaceae bacterium]|nr:hypothetical protein [Acidobacteriaceae bacterium]